VIAFATPWVLAGLALAAIPILLHLFARREPPTVDFPAVQYLAETARIHQHRLSLRHLLLLIIRTLLIVALVLAAAGPTLPGRGSMSHAPAALVLIFDNSVSSGVTEDGVPVLESLRDAGRRVLDRASTEDAVWVLAADGIARRGAPSELRQVIDSLTSIAARLDLGDAVSRAREILSGEDRPGEVLLISDLQASALGPASGTGPLTVARPGTATVRNVGLARVDAGTQPWISSTGQITIAAEGDTGQRRAVSVTLDRVNPSTAATQSPAPSQRQGLVEAGGALGLPLRVNGTGGGWQRLVVALAPDELRLDDEREMAVRVAPPARVVWDTTDTFIDAAVRVLIDGRRLEQWMGAGPPVTLGALGPGASIVVPPGDPARVGAVNRTLAARGIPWRYGALLREPGITDSSDVLGPHRVRLRHQLEAGGAESGVLVTIDGAPWLVRSGSVVILGSRLDTSWTDLPLSAPFVPFVDALANRLVSGDLAILDAAPGDRVLLPDAVDVVAFAGERYRVEGGAAFTAWEPGIHFLLMGEDTVGVLNVNLDPRESHLRRASDRMVRDLWPEATVVPLERAGELAFTAGARIDLRGPLLWLALALGLTEAFLAMGRRRRA
jgi:hypothetical protein